MEYLTLQDIPHRYYDQLHSQRMAASQSSERPLAHMAAAVSQPQNIPSSTEPTVRSYSLPFSMKLPPLEPLYPCHEKYESDRRKRKDVFRRHTAPAPAPTTDAPLLRQISLPFFGGRAVAETNTVMVSEPPSSKAASGERPTEAERIQLPPLGITTMRSGPSSLRENRDEEQSADASSEQPKDEGNSRSHSSSILTETQQHHMRSSPPIQPGEQHHAAKLPSFSEFLHTTRAETPPRTPSHRNGSVENSPRTRPLFEDVAWSGDHSRRRFDTLGDIYAPQPTDPRRMSSAIDPTLAYGSPRPLQHATMPAVAPEHHHRSSHSYPPPPSSMHSNASSSIHTRHQSSPVPPSHPSYAQQPPIHSFGSQAAYGRPSTHTETQCEHPRPGYYQERRPSGYLHDRGQDYPYAGPAYHGAPHVAYENPYHDIRFQQHVGLDHNAFNRKRRGNLPKDATNILKEWFAANRASPYPTEDQKLLLCNRTNLSLNQVSNWFINARRRAPQKDQRDQQNVNPSA